MNWPFCLQASRELATPLITLDSPLEKTSSTTELRNRALFANIEGSCNASAQNKEDFYGALHLEIIWEVNFLLSKQGRI